MIGVGKIYDIFAGQGLTETTPNHGNAKNMEKVFEIQKKDFDGLCYINLVDFDMMYGHRRDIPGYTNALNEFDEALGTFLANMRVDVCSLLLQITDVIRDTREQIIHERLCRFLDTARHGNRELTLERGTRMQILQLRSVSCSRLIIPVTAAALRIN